MRIQNVFLTPCRDGLLDVIARIPVGKYSVSRSGESIGIKNSSWFVTHQSTSQLAGASSLVCIHGPWPVCTVLQASD